MTDRPEELRDRLDGLDQIGEVVGALKAIASGQSAAARAAMAAISAHAATVAQAMALVAAEAPPPNHSQGPGLLLVVGAAQGFAGAYPQRIAEAARRARRPGMGLVVVGRRTVSTLQDAGVDMAWSDDLPAHPAAIPAFASRLTDAVIDLEAAHPGPVRALVGSAPDHPVPIFPPARLAQTAPGAAPLTTLPPGALLKALLGEALFAAIALALMQGLEAEAAARVQAMARARGNLQRRRDGVEAAYRQARQEQMTTELIELSVARQWSR